jgi:hypothetical protein
MSVIMLITFLLSIYFIDKNIYLSIFLLSGSVFFMFLSKNPKILFCTNIKEIDEIIPNLKGKTYLLGSFVILVTNILFKYFLY